MRRLSVFCALLLLAAPLLARSSWTLDAGETGEGQRWRGGAGTLQVGGTFGGGPTVTLEWTAGQPVSVWVELDSINCTFTSAGYCNFVVGNGDLRVVVTGGTGTGIVLAVVGEPYQASIGGGGGAAAWATITGGTSTEDFLVGTGGTFAETGTGSIVAGTARKVSSATTGAVIAGGTAVTVDYNEDSTTDLVLGNDAITFGTTAMSGTSGIGVFMSGGLFHVTNAGPDGWRYRLNSNVLETRGGLGALALFLDACSATIPCYAFSLDNGTGMYRDSTTGGVSIADASTEIMTAYFSTQPRMRIANTLEMVTIGTAPTLAAGERGLAWATSDNTLCAWNGSSWIKVSDGTACTF